MARIQVLPLPTETLGSASATPFVIVIDKCADDEFDDLLPFFMEPKAISEQIGARTILVFKGELTVENVDQELHDSAAAAIERALLPLHSAS